MNLTIAKNKFTILKNFIFYINREAVANSILKKTTKTELVTE